MSTNLAVFFTNLMIKKSFNLKGDLPKMPNKEIYLNVNALEKGDYKLHIINRNKLIKKTNFRKP